MINWARDLEFFDIFGGYEFRCTEFHGFGFLAIGCGEDDDFTAHLGCKLDGQVAESSYTNDAHAVGGFHGEGMQDIENGCAAAHEGSGVFARDARGNLEKEIRFPDCVGAETALIQIGVAVHGSFWAKGFVPSETLFAVTTGVMYVAPAHRIAFS